MAVQLVSKHAAVQAIYVPADDLTDPAPATTFAHLDATTVLSRGIAELGIYPAVDPLDSTSRMLNATIIGDEHYAVARSVQQVLQVRPGFTCPSHASLKSWMALQGPASDLLSIKGHWPSQCFI